jgi:hypothetical protein
LFVARRFRVLALENWVDMEGRNTKVIEKEMARRLHSDLK